MAAGDKVIRSYTESDLVGKAMMLTFSRFSEKLMDTRYGLRDGDSQKCNAEVTKSVSMISSCVSKSVKHRQTFNPHGNDNRYLYPHNVTPRDALDFEIPSEDSIELPYPEVEYIRPRCYLLTYFTGNPRKMVDDHFAKSLQALDSICNHNIRNRNNFSPPTKFYDHLQFTAKGTQEEADDDTLDDIMSWTPYAQSRNAPTVTPSKKHIKDGIDDSMKGLECSPFSDFEISDVFKTASSNLPHGQAFNKLDDAYPHYLSTDTSLENVIKDTDLIIDGDARYISPRNELETNNAYLQADRGTCFLCRQQTRPSESGKDASKIIPGIARVSPTLSVISME